MSQEVFGHTADDEPIGRIRIEGGGLTASVLTYGAALQDLRLEDHSPPLVLGFERAEDYLAHSPYFGANPGRFANRIGEGRVTLDGHSYQLDRNEAGKHHLHGGSRGIGKRNWRIVEATADSVRLTIDCADGEMGYPGNSTVTTTYALRPGGVLSIVHESTADRAAPANVAHHSYFNLDGRDTILDHELMLAADQYLPTDEAQIPTGEIADIAGTAFDFRDMREIRCEASGRQVRYDHNFCLSGERGAKRSVALARSLYSGVTLEVRTGEPGLQFYCGFKLDVPVPGLDGRRYGAFAGLCLEAQNWPDAPNHANFPGAILRPGKILRQETDYVFARS